jgi:hypothetical protein
MGTAYLIFWINTDTLTADAVGIYGEEHPTGTFNLLPACVLRMRGEGYPAAGVSLIQYMNRHARWAATLEVLRTNNEGVPVGTGKELARR